MSRTQRLFEIGDDIWEVNFPFSLMGVQLGRRMVIIREPGKGLQLHSPGLIDSELKLELERLGTVSSLVVPTNFHDTFVPEALKTFPDAVLYAPPGFADHCRTDHPAISLDEAPASWAEVLKWKKIQGIPKLNEHVFLHGPSKSLIVADLVFNIGSEADWWTRQFLRLNGAFNVLRPTRIFRSQIKDSIEFQASVQQVLAWDFDRLIPSHGRIVPSGARQRLKQEFTI